MNVVTDSTLLLTGRINQFFPGVRWPVLLIVIPAFLIGTYNFIDILSEVVIEKRRSEVADYENRFKEEASTFGGHTYDALMILSKAIEKVGPDAKKVRGAIENMTGYFGTAGDFNFSAKDHNGLGIDAFTMVMVKDGKFVPYSKK